MQEKVVGPATEIDFLGFIIDSFYGNWLAFREIILHQANDPVVKIQYKA